MKQRWLFLLVLLPTLIVGQTKDAGKSPQSSNLRQYYSGKFGFYQPSDGLNNGLLFGLDGITEFVNYNFFLSGVIDFYNKQTIGIFNGSSKPNVSQQQMVLLPLHANFGLQLFDVPNADTRGYVGAGFGYYFYFYSVEYQSGSGGILGGPGLTSQSDSKNGGNLFGSLFFRVLIGQIFLEPRFYIAAKKEDTVNGGYQFVVNPSGFAITLGFQYH